MIPCEKKLFDLTVEGSYVAESTTTSPLFKHFILSQ